MFNAELAKTEPGADRVVVARAWYYQACRMEELVEAHEHVTTQLTLPGRVILWARDNRGEEVSALGATAHLALVELARILRDRRTAPQHGRAA